MEHLCAGSYVRIMTSCAIPAERKFDPFCEKIFVSLCKDEAKVFSYTSADGTGDFYDKEDSIINLTTTDGDTVYLYAQWTAQ